MRRFRALGAGLAAAFLAIGWPGTTAWSQGFVVDRRPGMQVARSFEIKEVSIVGRVRDQVAEVQVSQTFHNPGSTMVESEFLFPMPEEGAVQDFVLLVDGRELPGRILPKDEARRIYEEIVRVKRDPALLEYMGRGLYRTSVFPIPPGADRKVTMRFTQLCKRDRDVVEFTYPLSTQKFTAKPIQRLSVELSIRSKEPIKSIYCPTDDASIRRFDDHEVDVKLERRDVIPEHDFRLVTTLAEGKFSASLLSYRPSESEDGYFLVLASPEVKRADERPLPKTVIFVIDRSGSMAGKKIEQARRTLKSVLNNLRDDDLFNVVAYDDRVESFKPELQRYGSQSREEAQRFVDNIREGGSTNINDALQTALKMIHDRSRPGYILFLTDGLPTAGEINEMRIAANCRHANEKHARVFCFGVGYDVNARLLDRLSGGNSGTSEYVKPDEDIEAHVGRFYAKMTSPVLTDIHLELSGVDINRTYPRDLPDLFEGGQLVVAGRYRHSGRTTIRVNGRVGDERRTFEFPADLAGTDRGSGHEFVERLWAVRRVGDLIDQIDMNGQNRELVDELVDLSRKYGLMTPYTSFLADENVPLHANAENQRRAGMMLSELRQADGPSGVSQRDIKQGLIQANRPGMISAQGSGTGRMGGMGGGMGGVGRRSQFAAQSPSSATLGHFDQSQQPGQNQPGQSNGNQPGPGGANQIGQPTQSGQNPSGNQTGQPGQNPLASVARERKVAARPAGQPGMGAMMGGSNPLNAPTFANNYQPGAPGAGQNGAGGPLQQAQSGPQPARLRQIGTKTFYFKDGRWVDSSVKPEEDAKAEKVVQFSDAYFRLARAQKAEYNQYFSQSEPVTVKLDGKVYRIDPAPPEKAL